LKAEEKVEGDDNFKLKPKEARNAA